MSKSNSILNTQSGKTCYTSGGQCTATNTIYAAECTQHKLIYVGQSSQKLNMRFNGHRSDVNVKPKSCELAQHFHGSHECHIKKDLKVYILQDNVIGSREKKESRDLIQFIAMWKADVTFSALGSGALARRCFRFF